MPYKKLIKASYNASLPNTIKTIFYSFSLVATHTFLPQATIAQEKPSTEEVEIGYGTAKKSNFTGAVTEVNVKDMTIAPVYSFTEALGGRAAGIQVSAADGQPGAAMNIMIRNISYLFKNNAPLFVIDGTIVPDFHAASINSEDIETLNILKDGAATAIYGIGAANGVVLIKTKKGQEGQPVISFNNAVGFQEVTKKMELMSPYEFVKYQEELNPQSAATRYFSGGKTLASYQNEEGIHWQDLIFRRSLVRMHNLSLRGGSSTTRYAISGANFDQRGVVDHSGAKRYQGRVALDQDITDKITFGVNLSYSQLLNSGKIVSENSGYSFLDTFNSRIWTYRTVAGNDYDLINSEYDLYANRVNPVALNNNENRNNEVLDLFANVSINYTILKNFTFRTTGSYIERKSKTSLIRAHIGPSFGYEEEAWGTESSYNKEMDYWFNDNTLTFDQTFGSHQLNILGGFGIRSEKGDENSLSESSAPGSFSYLKSYQENKFQYKSYFGRLFYGYKSKYLLEGSYRADKSKYASVHHHSSAAVAWNIHEESFLKNLTTLTASKLRMSYGKEKGMLQIADQFNIGYDLGLFNNRIALSVDVYKRTIRSYTFKTIIVRIPGIDADIVMPNPINTLPDKLQNKGLELNLNTINVKSDSFSWQTNFNINFNKNKILRLYGSEDYRFFTPVINSYTDRSYFEPRVGHDAGALYGLTFDGVYQYSDFDKSASGTYTPRKNVPSFNNYEQVQPGDIKYKDINGDGVVNAEDGGEIGSSIPLHTGGLNNNFTYKNFDLNIFFQWSYGNDIYNVSRLHLEGNATRLFGINQFARYTNRWTPENPTNENYRAGAREYYHSSRVLEDGSYLRLKTASLAYNVPQRHISKLHLSKLQLHVTAQNLLTFTKYSGMDPEVSIRNNTQMPGVDISAYPQARTLMFGINASF